MKHRIRLGWKDLTIAVLWLLLWNTNRRRSKTDFVRSGSGSSVEDMVPTFIGLTEGAIDPGNRVDILQNGAFFDRLLDDIARARSSIHMETFVWWNGEICDRIAESLAS